MRNTKSMIRHDPLALLVILTTCLASFANGQADAVPPSAETPSAEMLIDQLRTGDLQQQVKAVKQMQKVADGDVAKVVPPLIKAMNSPLTEVRAATGATLPLLAPRAAGAVPALCELALSDDLLDARTAIAMLREIGPAAKDAVPTLIKVLDSKDFHSQYWSCRALGSIGAAAESSLPKLIALTTQGVTSVRGNAATALADVSPNGGEEIVDVLIVALDDYAYSVRSKAARALGKIGPNAEKASKPLRDRMVNADYTSNAPAATAYWKITGDAESAVDALIAIISITDHSWEGADGIVEIGPAAKCGVDRLTELLGNKHAVIRSAAAIALAGIGPAAKPAMPALRKLLDDPEDEVQESAQSAIRAIFGNAKSDSREKAAQ